MGKEVRIPFMVRILLPALKRAVESTERALCPGRPPSLGGVAPNDATSGRAPRAALCSSSQRSALSICRRAIFAPRFSILPRLSTLPAARSISRSGNFSLRPALLRRRIFSSPQSWSACVALCHDAKIWPGVSRPAKLRARACLPILPGARRFSQCASPPATPVRRSLQPGPARGRLRLPSPRRLAQQRHQALRLSPRPRLVSRWVESQCFPED